MAEPSQSPPAPAPPPTSPALERLRLQVEQAKLEKELAEQNAGRARAMVGDWSGVSAENDTVTTTSDDPSGLVDVLVSRAAVPVADDIADKVWTALNAVGPERDAQILIVGSTAVIADCDTYQVVRANLDQMMDRAGVRPVAAAPPAQEAPAAPPGPELTDGGEVRTLLFGVAATSAVSAVSAIGAVLPVVAGVAGVAGKLLGRSYTVSGKVAQGLDDLGFDLQLANEVLARAETATVQVGRLTPMSTTALFEDVRRLASALRGPLASRLALAESQLARDGERAKQAQSSLEAARSQIAELVRLLTAADGEAANPALTELAALRAQTELVRAELLERRAEQRRGEVDPTAQAAAAAKVADLEGELAGLREQTAKVVATLADVEDTGGPTPRTQALGRALQTEAELVERLPELRAAEALSQADRDEAQHLCEEGLAFLAEVVTVSGQEPAPLIRAGRVESLMTGGEYSRHVILMARVLRGGVDRVLETKLGPDRRSVLAGITVEWALLRPTGELLAGGVRTGLRASEGAVGKLADMRENDVSYIGVPRQSEKTRDKSVKSSGPADRR